MDTEPRWSRRNGWIAVAVAGLAGALLGATARIARPLAESAEYWQGRGARHAWLHHGGHAEWIAERLLAEIDATGEQEEAVTSALEKLFEALEADIEAHRARHESFLDAFSGPEIDREALESLRQEEARTFDRASRRIVDALAEIGETLTEAQRDRIIELALDVHRSHHRGRWLTRSGTNG